MRQLSIIIPVLDSHAVVQRQLFNFRRIGIPAGCEVIIVDDGSDPPLVEWFGGSMDADWLHILRRDDLRPWTWPLARNLGAEYARGKNLMMIDIDHFVLRDAIEQAMRFDGPRLRFTREFGVLLEDGTFTQDEEILREYGLPAKRLRDRGVRLTPHPNMFIMRRDVFFDLGGYREDFVGRPYPQGEDSEFKNRWHKAKAAGRYAETEERAKLYMFPVGKYAGDVDADPKGLFHTLSRKTHRNPFWTSPS